MSSCSFIWSSINLLCYSYHCNRMITICSSNTYILMLPCYMRNRWKNNLLLCQNQHYTYSCIGTVPHTYMPSCAITSLLLYKISVDLIEINFIITSERERAYSLYFTSSNVGSLASSADAFFCSFIRIWYYKIGKKKIVTSGNFIFIPTTYVKSCMCFGAFLVYFKTNLNLHYH